MNIKLTSALVILCAALHAPAFAQSGTITFKGRILAPVCSGTPIIDQSQAHLSNAPPDTFALDNTGCEHGADALVASVGLSQNDAPSPAAFVAPEQGEAEPVWTITYH